jgi:calcineurin-like phosphoesterase family protein
MNEAMIAKWNSVVTNDDIVYHLGDFSFGEPGPFVSRLKGRINLIMGNHDRKNYNYSGFESVALHKTLTIGDRKVFMCHRPPYSFPNKYERLSEESDYCIHGHIHNRRAGVFDKKFYNVSVEVLNYQPKLLTDILEEIDDTN